MHTTSLSPCSLLVLLRFAAVQGRPGEEAEMAGKQRCHVCCMRPVLAEVWSSGLLSLVVKSWVRNQPLTPLDALRSAFRIALVTKSWLGGVEWPPLAAISLTKRQDETNLARRRHDIDLDLDRGGER